MSNLTALSMRSWIAPSLNKTALLIHGNRELGDAWFAVAEGLNREGYAVYAPDLMNNGFSSPVPPPHVFPSDHAKFIHDHLPSQKFDLFCGVSIGGNIAVELWKLLSPATRPDRMVLLEPGYELKFPPGLAQMIAKSQDTPKTEDKLREEHPNWTPRDVAVDRLGLVFTNKEAFQWMFTQQGDKEFAFTPLSELPSDDEFANTEVIILGADPTKRAMFDADKYGALLAQHHPKIKVGQVAGAAHLIHKDVPEAVIDALSGRFGSSHLIRVVRG